MFVGIALVFDYFAGVALWSVRNVDNLLSTPGPADARCVDAQIAMRVAINSDGHTQPGKMNDLKAIEHCEGF